MKELSIEQKAKRYDEAIKVAKGNYETIVQMDNDCTFAKEGIVNTFHHIFPELKESEEESIKEWLINLVKGHIEWLEDRVGEQLSNGQVYGDELVKAKNSLAWLEWQGKISDKIVERARTEKQRILVTESDGVANIDWDTRSLQDVKLLLKYGLDYIKKLEKQGEQILANSAKTCKDEQKPAENVEPKFKVGDCVMCHRNDSSTEIMNVYDIRDNRYYFNDNIHFSWSVRECDEKCHLWTIKDAKDGDILCSNQIIVLFKQWEDNTDYNFVIAYAGIDISGKLQITDEHWLISNKSKPATKEQRDLLFQKMHDAGYEWDAEKKELKKIKQTYTNNQFTSAQASVLNRHINKFLEEKSAWDEDEKIRKSLINYIHCYGDAGDYTKKEFIAWVKKQGEHANFLSKIQVGDKVTRNEAGILVNISQLNRDAKPTNNQFT